MYSPPIQSVNPPSNSIFNLKTVLENLAHPIQVLSSTYGSVLDKMGISRVVSNSQYRGAVLDILLRSIENGATTLSSDTFWIGRNLSAEDSKNHAEVFRNQIKFYFDLFDEVLSDLDKGEVVGKSRRDIKTLFVHLGPQADCYSRETNEEDELFDFHYARFQEVQVVVDETRDKFEAMGFERRVLVETVPTFKEAMQAMKAAKAQNLEVKLSFTLNADGKLFDGISVSEAIQQIDGETDEWGEFGLNCAGIGLIEDVLWGLRSADLEDRLKIVYPNATEGFQPNLEKMQLEEIEAITPSAPERAQKIHNLKTLFPKVKYWGECCGCSPEAVGHICKAVRG